MIRITLIVLQILIGVGAVAGGVLLMRGGIRLPWGGLQRREKRAVAVWVVLVAIGLVLLVAAGSLLQHASIGRLVSLEAGVLFAGYVAAQLTLMGYRHPLQPVALGLGLVVVVLSVAMRSPG